MAIFEIHYQPLLNLRDNKVTGCESPAALATTQACLISPADFIPVAEDTGLINQLGEWVLGMACAEAATWPDHIRVSVNVSPVQLRNQTSGTQGRRRACRVGSSRQPAGAGITEAVLIRDDEAALAILHQLRELGVRIAARRLWHRAIPRLSYLQRFSVRQDQDRPLLYQGYRRTRRVAEHCAGRGEHRRGA